MTIYAKHEEQAIEVDKPCKGIDLILEARNTQLGGFGIRRLLPSHHQRMVGPWIFFDHFGPTQFKAGKGVDVLPHPHINMATVTYLFEGEMLHQDSTSVVQTIKPGAVNVMFAGKGIVHSERTPQETRAAAHSIHGLQLWLAVPENNEEEEPGFFHFGEDVVPTFQVGNISGRVLMGTAYGVTSPVKTFSPTLYFEATLPEKGRLTLPSDVKELGIYVVSGELLSEGRTIEEGMMAISTHHEGIQVSARSKTKIVVIGGEPLGERHIWWNFVSSNKERINKAAVAWERGEFPDIPTDNGTSIPLPTN